ncbi:hypothetical protein [Halochromatium salexigens]|uniref:Phospholipase A2 n=1 Tax=Halochromatium salexigens TaxID=49447 RepID=A0AAJ0XGN3_HALSE|nr:hypothetical protein [Halochromatium salexigens]MBK5931723.1 hypothetical protein [Halochromatium salexigens]
MSRHPQSFPLSVSRSALLAGALLLLAAGNAAAFKCMPLYGNWCGINHPSHGWPPPVDAFDAACMRHDLCTAQPGPDTGCDIAFVSQLHGIAAQVGYLPRPLQWAEYVIRLKAGGPWGGMPLPTPGDALGVMSSLAAPCW